MRLVQHLLRVPSVATLFLMASCLARADDSGSFKIPATWHVLYDVKSSAAAKQMTSRGDAKPYRAEIRQVDVFGDYLGFEVQFWPVQVAGWAPHAVYPLKCTLQVLNLVTSAGCTTDLGRQQRLRGPHFLGRDGLVLVGTSVLYDRMRKKAAVDLSLDHAEVTRVPPAEFLVNEEGSFHLVDCSALPEGKISIHELANPAPTSVRLLASRQDHIVGWSARSSPYDVVLFSRGSGEIVWKDRIRRNLLGIGEKYVYMWSYRVDQGYAKNILVRKALEKPYRAESIYAPLLAYTPGVIDFNWPNMLLVVREEKTGMLRVVKVDLKHETTTLFDFSAPRQEVSVHEGSAADSRPSLSDTKTRIQYQLRGDASGDRVIVASDSAIYSVPMVKPSQYEWTDWRWKPYSFEDSE